MKITIFTEHNASMDSPEAKLAYPEGMNECLRLLMTGDGHEVKMIVHGPDDDGSELTEEILKNTDVLVWWGHWYHGTVNPAVVDMVVDYVNRGMGMLALHSAQERIAKWAEKNDIDLVLMHGRGGAVGRGGGPANKAVLAQPKGSVNCFFKLTEQGEVIFARYGNRTLAQRHVESVAAATLLQSAPSVEKTNTETTQKFWDMADKLNAASHERYLDLLNTEDFTPWFSTVTPLTEVGLLPIGSRPAKRGLGAKSLDDLRTIPWIFSWSQARINLAAWYGLGTACEQFGDLDQLKAAYQEWPFFRTFIDNIEMSIAKTDQRIAKMYLHLGDRQDLSKKVFTEMQLTRKWVLAIVGDEWPLQRRRVLGCAVRVRNPYVDALSIAQVRALREVRMNQDEMAEEKKAEYMSLILSTVTGVSAGLQNTG